MLQEISGKNSGITMFYGKDYFCLTKVLNKKNLLQPLMFKICPTISPKYPVFGYILAILFVSNLYGQTTVNWGTHKGPASPLNDFPTDGLPIQIPFKNF